MVEQLDIPGIGKGQAARLARDIFLKIVKEQYKEGAQLPSVRDIARNSSVSDYSARKILLGLVNAGLVESKQGKGMFVASGAKDRAVKLLEGYDDEFIEIKEATNRSKSVTVAIAAAFKHTIDGPQLYHPQTISGIYKEANSLGFNVELISFDADISNPATVMKIVKDNGYNGVIWLYPEINHWNSLNMLVDNRIPLVLSSHWLFDTTLPCVQINEYSSTVAVLKHLAINESCDTIDWFSTEAYRRRDEYADNDYASVAASGGYRILNMAMGMVGDVNCKLNIIEYKGCSVTTERELKELVCDDKMKHGLVIANSPEFTDFFKRNPECFEKIQRHSLVVASTINQFPRLVAIERELGDINVCLVPFEDVGRALATKINGLLEGRFVENTTLINTTFDTYSNIIGRSSRNCADNGFSYSKAAGNATVLLG